MVGASQREVLQPWELRLDPVQPEGVVWGAGQLDAVQGGPGDQLVSELGRLHVANDPSKPWGSLRAIRLISWRLRERERLRSSTAIARIERVKPIPVKVMDDIPDRARVNQGCRGTH